VRGGRAVEIGLGSAANVPLKLARELRDDHMADLAKGIDPREEKRKASAARLGRRTFAEAAAAVIAARRDTWRPNANDARISSLVDWTRSLTVACKPIAKRAVEDIDSDEIDPIVRQYWDKGHLHTTRRVLKRIETVFNYAKAMGWRKTDNPATWGVFEHRLQARAPSGPKRHYPALDWRDMPAFMARLRATESSMAALALDLTVLTASRSGEVRGMLWTEINLDTATWTVPPSRMKRAREHQVPLSDNAMTIIRRLEAARIGPYVFPGRSNRKPIAHWAMWNLVQTLTGRQKGEPIAASPHGFRSSFRSWATSKKVPSEIAERCLAHERKDAVQAAYDREEMLDHRREVMERWADFLSGRDASNVVSIKRGAA
jgi:integrase